jgi:tetratricopeptide (TPR) repeat protein
VLFLYTDLPLFNTQYLYYTNGGRKNWRDIKIVHTGMLGADFYVDVLKSQYPDVDLSSIWKDRTKAALTVVADKFINSYPIVSDTVLPVDSKKYGWVSEGLLYRLYKIVPNVDPMSKTEYISTVKSLFASYQDPRQGALSTYTHVMLAGVLRVYAFNYFDAGKVFLSLGEYQTAEKYFRTAQAYVPQLYDVDLPLAQTLIYEKNCTEAESILKLHVSLLYTDPAPYGLLVNLYRNCLHDELKAKEYEQLYNEKQKQKQIQLKEY